MCRWSVHNKGKSSSMASTRKTIVASGKSWHGRLYRYWLRHGFQASEYQDPARKENLCHYVRVVLLWSWLTWLFRTSPKKHLRWLRPWMPVALGSLILAITISAMRWPQGTWDVLMALILMLALMAGMVLLSVGLAAGLIGAEQALKGDGFVLVLRNYVSAKKAKICPYIERRDME